jgi:hypothetical protein
MIKARNIVKKKVGVPLFFFDARASVSRQGVGAGNLLKLFDH